MILLHFPIPVEIQLWFGLKHLFSLCSIKQWGIWGCFFPLFLFTEKSIIYFMWCQSKQCIPEQSKEPSSLTLIPVLHLVYLKSLPILKPLRINCIGFKPPLLWLLPAVASHRKEDLDINKWCCIASSGLKIFFFIYSLSSGVAYWNVPIGAESSGRTPRGSGVLVQGKLGVSKKWTN